MISFLFADFESLRRKSSQLCKSFQEILHDKNSLGFFIQFLEARKAGQLIRFWLDAESFQASTWSRIRSHSLNIAKKKRQTPNENENISDINCDQQQKLHKDQHSSPNSVEKLVNANLESNRTKDDCVPSNISVISNSAKECDLPQIISPSREVTQNLSADFHNNDHCKSSSNAANNVNTGKDKRSDYTPDSDVFVESPVHESTTFNQTIKQSSQDWADKLKKSKY